MIAYNQVWINNLFIQKQTSDACASQLLTKQENEQIISGHPIGFYSPNLFIRIGLFILTVIILLFSFGLIALVFMNSIENTIGGLAIFFAVLWYAALEFMVRQKKHFKSGVDDALMWASAGSSVSGIAFLFSTGDIANCMLLFLVSLYCAVRFADRLMSIGAYISLLSVVFFTCIKIGPAAKMLMPFIGMSISAIVYWLVQKRKTKSPNHLYLNCLVAVSIASLIGFYLAGNYFVVREMSNELFHLHLAEKDTIAMGWLFWLFTFTIPVLYLVTGIQKKDIALIRVAFSLGACIVFTVRYYHHVLPAEIIMTFGGIVLILISYGISRLLRTPRFGFTRHENDGNELFAKTQIESLLVAETMTEQVLPTEAMRFGGGNFGGGGASGEF